MPRERNATEIDVPVGPSSSERRTSASIANRSGAPLPSKQGHLDRRARRDRLRNECGESAQREVPDLARHEPAAGERKLHAQRVARAPALEDPPFDRVHVSERERETGGGLARRDHGRDGGVRDAPGTPQQIETGTAVQDRRQVEPDVATRALEDLRRDLALDGQTDDHDVSLGGRPCGGGRALLHLPQPSAASRRA